MNSRLRWRSLTRAWTLPVSRSMPANRLSVPWRLMIPGEGRMNAGLGRQIRRCRRRRRDNFIHQRSGWLLDFRDNWGGGGGGISLVVPIPFWQRAWTCRPTRDRQPLRNFPDVAMVSQQFIGLCRWPARTGLFKALALRRRFGLPSRPWSTSKPPSNGQAQLGFVNPPIYVIAGSNYTSRFPILPPAITPLPPARTSFMPSLATTLHGVGKPQSAAI